MIFFQKLKLYYFSPSILSSLCHLSINNGPILPVTEDASLSVILRYFLNSLWHTEWINPIFFFFFYRVVWCCLSLLPFWSANLQTDTQLAYIYALRKRHIPSSPISVISNKLTVKSFSCNGHTFASHWKSPDELIETFNQLHLSSEHRHKMRHFT